MLTVLNEQHIRCVYTTSVRNIQLRDDCIALTARRESDSYGRGIGTHWYTSAKLKSMLIRVWYSHVTIHVDMRVALPRGKMLSPVAYLGAENSNADHDNFIDIFRVYGTNHLNSGLRSNRSHVKNRSYRKNHYVFDLIHQADLSKFHKYGVEINSQYVKWFFNDREYLKVDGLLGVEFSMEAFNVIVELNVGGDNFVNQSLGDTDNMGWQCSALIIDYIRVYEVSEWEHVLKSNNTEHDRSVDICNDIMNEIKHEQLASLPEIGSNTYMLIGSIGIVLVLIITLIPIAIFMYCKQKRMKQMTSKQESENNYENDSEMDMSSDENVDHDYDNPYEGYGSVDNKYGADHGDPYLDITNRYVKRNNSSADIYDDNDVDDYIGMKTNF
jgi:hypothetical protein